MDFSAFENVLDAAVEDLPLHLGKLAKEADGRCQFSELDGGDRRGRVWSRLFQLLLTPDCRPLYIDVLTTVKALTRDKTGLSEAITEDRFQVLLDLSGLGRSAAAACGNGDGGGNGDDGGNGGGGGGNGDDGGNGDGGGNGDDGGNGDGGGNGDDGGNGGGGGGNGDGGGGAVAGCNVDSADCQRIAGLALRCVYNMIRQSDVLLNLFARHHTAFPALTALFSSADYRQMSLAERQFRLQLLTVLASLSPQLRVSACNSVELVRSLVDELERCCAILASTEAQEDADQVCALVCDVLRALYALLCGRDSSASASSVSCSCCSCSGTPVAARDCRLSRLLAELVVTRPRHNGKVVNHCLQVLCCVDPECLSPIFTATNHQQQQQHQQQQLPANTSCGSNRLQLVLLQLLTTCFQPTGGVIEHECAISLLMFLAYACKVCRPVRKFFKFHVLPPRRDVTVRPGEGSDLKSALVRLMTSPQSELSLLSAHFLFILCKDNVDRLVKYTGFGNAAGLLSSRGLLLGAQTTTTTAGTDSSDSDSDTDEYLFSRNDIDPVTGSVEPDLSRARDALQEMSEERKMFETEKLLNALQKSIDNGVIRPCRVGDDGRVHPISHVMEMREQAASSQTPGNDASSDSD